MFSKGISTLLKKGKKKFDFRIVSEKRGKR